MTASAAQLREARKWYGLALPHLRMARQLLKAGFADGAVFHGYHAYECVLSAFIASNGYPVPPEGITQITLPKGRTVRVYPSPKGHIKENSAHKARIIFFNELANTAKPYYATHLRLGRILTLPDRMGSLYYDPVTDLLPHQKYHAAFARGLLLEVHRFTETIRPDIP